MPEFDKISYSKSGKPPDFSYDEQLINNMRQVESERDWSDYKKEDDGRSIIYTYNDNVEEENEIEEFIL